MTQVPVAPAPRRRLRSLGAMLAGIIAIVALSIATDQVLHSTRVFPPPGQPMSTALWLFATVYRCAFGIFGSWIAARLAPDRPMWHAIVLGIVGVFLSTLGTVATWNMGEGYGPHWYPLSLVATALPCAWIGGRLATMGAPVRA